MTEPRCPRCSGPLGDRPARSRLTAARDTYVCTTCGTDEAVREATGKAPTPFGDWPVLR
ncbi:hypothetical protein [Streptomyces sp. NPDC051561]|uniref:hypothetical protein n=1 Tax=Streptomyces sp. NPDC051561 TaxID=3365658 RepID=UPI00379F2A01